MPRASEFQRHQEKVEQRRASQQSAFAPPADYFRCDDGHASVVRFLEQGDDQLFFATVHRVRTGQYMSEILCLDQEDEGVPCPFCQSEVREIRSRSTKGFVNVIQRGGPEMQAWNQQRVANGETPFDLGTVYRRNDYGKTEKDALGNPIALGYADTVCLWKHSKTCFEQVRQCDRQMNGLMSRDMIVTRTGRGMRDTRYSIFAVNIDAGPQPMSENDQALAAQKYDLVRFTTPMSYDDAVQLLSGAPMAGGPQPTFDRGAGSGFGVQPVQQPQVASADNVFQGGAPVRSSAFGN